VEKLKGVKLAGRHGLRRSTQSEFNAKDAMPQGAKKRMERKRQETFSSYGGSAPVRAQQLPHCQAPNTYGNSQPSSFAAARTAALQLLKTLHRRKCKTPY